MALQKHLLSFVVVLVLSSLSCYTSLNGDQPHNYLPQKSSHYFRTRDSFLNTNRDAYDLADAAQTKFSVDDYGTKGDGTTDDSEAFGKAFTAACSATGAVSLVVPQSKNYLLKPVKFTGPCKSYLTAQILGTIKASDNMADYKNDPTHWIHFDSINNLVVEGGGTGILNGNGKIWWDASCKKDKSRPCMDAPTALTFGNCQNLTVQNLHSQDAQQIHVSFEKCVNVQAIKLTVTAPGDSPNTDGIHVANTQNIQIKSCIIGTGDDCISIVSGSEQVNATDITCGPGHGISIGSLGKGHSEADVSSVFVNGANLTGTTNGVRIKTWQGGSGFASHITFQNVQMNNVENPIIIDQNYCDPCLDEKSSVQVRDVVYQDIKGTSASQVAITFNCSGINPCQGIVLQNVNLQGGNSGTVQASCINVKHNDIGVVSPNCPN